MVEIDVLLHAAAQGSAVHDRHVHIADYQVRSLVESSIESFFSVSETAYMVVRGKFSDQIPADILVIVDDEDMVFRL